MKRTFAALSALLFLYGCQAPYSDDPTVVSVDVSTIKNATEDETSFEKETLHIRHLPGILQLMPNDELSVGVTVAVEDPAQWLLISEAVKDEDNWSEVKRSGFVVVAEVTSGSGLVQEHALVSINNKIYWQWVICREDCISSQTVFYIDPFLIDYIFNVDWLYPDGVILDEVKPQQELLWERFDGETLEPILEQDSTWMLEPRKGNPADVLQLRNNRP